MKKKRMANLGKILGLAVGMLIGFLIGKAAGAGMAQIPSVGGGLIWLGVLIVAFALLLYLQIAVHEAGHLVGGLLSGYRFSSYRIGSWMLLREQGRLVLRRLSVAGTGGQCLMVPPPMCDWRMPYVLYNLGGVLANLVLSAVFFLLWMIGRGNVWLEPVWLMGWVIGAFLALTNGIPMRLGLIDNDGRNAISLGRDAAALRAFWGQMQINAALADGVRLREMPDEWFAAEESGMRNVMTATIAVFACNRLMDQHAFAEADARMTALIEGENAILGLHRNLLVCDCICCALMAGEPERAGMLYTAEQKQFMRSMRNYPAVIRTEYARACLYERDSARAQALEVQFARAAARYPYEADLALERELMAMAREAAEKQN